MVDRHCSPPEPVLRGRRNAGWRCKHRIFSTLGLWTRTNEMVSGPFHYSFKSCTLNHKLSEREDTFKINRPVFAQVRNGGSEKLEDFPTVRASRQVSSVNLIRCDMFLF